MSESAVADALADAVVAIWRAPTFDGWRDRQMLRGMAAAAGVPIVDIGAALERARAKAR